jgi:hypothetical protein
MFPSQSSVDRPHIAPAEYIHGRLDPFCNQNISSLHCDELCIAGNLIMCLMKVKIFAIYTVTD